jgi:hypothetical protein
MVSEEYMYMNLTKYHWCELGDLGKKHQVWNNLTRYNLLIKNVKLEKRMLI